MYRPHEHTPPFICEVLIGGTQSTLERARDITGISEPGRRGCVSFDRIVPRPLCIEGTADQRAEFSERFLAEVFAPCEKLLGDFVEENSIDFYSRSLAQMLHQTCEGLWKVGFTSEQPGSEWMREHWGTTFNVVPPEKQEPGSAADWHAGRLFARLPIGGWNTTPPLAVFDALARMLPGAEIDLAWSSEDMYISGESTGVARWRNGLQVGCFDSKFFDRDDPFGQLQSLRPLEVARAISKAGFADTRCRPTVRWNLTAAGLEGLLDGETITIPIGPAHEATVGSDPHTDFRLDPGDRVDAEDIDWNCGVIRLDEVWHRIYGSVDGMSLGLSLHSTEVVEENIRALAEFQGNATRREWIASQWTW